MNDNVVLQAENLSVTTSTGAMLVAGVDLTVPAGSLVGLVGETGAGKTVAARAMLGMLAPGLRATGRVRIAGGDWLGLHEPDRIRRLLGRGAGLMLQNPMGAFDPVQRIGPQLVEATVRNGQLSRQEANARMAELCLRLGLGEASDVAGLYPHQLSGGMSQRAALALTLMSAPKVLVVDEPTSALDANLRVDALRLLQSVAREDGTGIVMISHDLGLVSRFCDWTSVLYAGHVAEQGPTAALLTAPAHPYTRMLISCSLRLDQEGRTRLATVGGEPPAPGSWPGGCYFHPRCPDSRARCREERPILARSGQRAALCHFADLEVRL